jgi:Leishmanolysin
VAKLITYKIVDDVNGRLKTAARTACNFWNRFVQPKTNIVIRLGTFTSFGNTIARAYEPYKQGNTVYGVIEFNTHFIAQYNDVQVAGTVAHELGHTLGIGWSRWMKLFDANTGKFKAAAIQALPALANMSVETDYGPGTTLSHWDEDKFGTELMTGFKGGDEHVLPVTIDVVGLLGHRVIEQLKKKTSLDTLLAQVANVQFAQKDAAKALDLDYFKATPIWEETYDMKRRKKPLGAG